MVDPNGLLARASSSLHDLSFRVGRPLAARALFWLSRLEVLVQQTDRGVTHLLTASRYSDSRDFTSSICSNLELVRHTAPRLLPPCTSLKEIESRLLVLAEPMIEDGRVLRKGVLLVSFTETAARLYSCPERERLIERFHLVLEPSFAGYADPAILCWLNVPEPVLVQATERLDREFLTALNSNLIPVPYGAGDWIDPDLFAPEASEKTYAALCVANYLIWKRTHAFLAAIRKARTLQPSLRAALVLAGSGKTKNSAQRTRGLITYYGLQDCVDVYERLDGQRLREVYGRSRCLVFPSWKEGSSRVVYEAMCMNVPVLVLQENVGVNKNYIVEETGVVVPEDRLAEEIVRQNRQPPASSARQWFIDHLGPVNTRRKLATDLASAFPDERWNEDELYLKANTPEARYLSDGPETSAVSAWLTH